MAATTSPIVTCTAPVNIAVIKYCKYSPLPSRLSLLTTISLQGEREMKPSSYPSTTLSASP